MSEALRELAAAYGVQAEFDDWQGRPHSAPPDSVQAVLAALGVDTADPEAALAYARDREWRDVVPPVTVRRAFHPVGVPFHVPAGSPVDAELVCEDGSTRPLAVGDPGETREVDGRPLVRRGALLPDDLPDGYHRIRVSSSDGTAEGLVIGAPYRCYLPDDLPRLWGWMVQLYSVRSRGSWGLGDLHDLRSLAEWSAREGAGFLLCNPLHAADPVEPRADSPYFPTSRRFHDPAYLRLDDLPEISTLSGDAKSRYDELAQRGRALTEQPVLARREAWEAKAEALWLAFLAMPERRRKEFDRWRRARGAALRDFATYCALAERYGVPWPSWPASLRRPGARGVAAARRELADRVAFHAWLQWSCSQQLDAAQSAALRAGMPIGVIHDLAVGVHPGGADAWALQDDLATGMYVGAPPDEFNQLGQNWRQPPLRPDRLLLHGLAPFREIVGAALRHGGGVRIDHAVGLFRLYWIPSGGTPADGVFVRYPASALLAVLALETCRASSIAVAEDLGVIPPGVSDTLRDWGLLGSEVMRFARRDDGWRRRTSDYPVRAFTSVTTHDLPTAAGFWSGRALETQISLGLLRPGVGAADARGELEQEQRELRGVLSGESFVGPDASDASDEELAHAMHAFVARTPSLLAGVQLADAVGQVEQQNVPGTIDEYPNWRVPLAEVDGTPVFLEDLPDHPDVRRIVDTMTAERPRP